MKIPVVVVSILAPIFIQANTACRTPSLFDFSVVTIESMNCDQSDIQGSVAVGTQLRVSDYEIKGNPNICVGAAVGRSLHIERAQTFKNIEIGESNLVADFRSARVNGNVSSLSQTSFDQVRVTGVLTSTERSHVHRSSVRIRRTQPGLSVSHETLRAQMLAETARLDRPANTQTQTALLVHTIEAQNGTSIVDISNLTLEGTHLKIQNKGAQRVVLVHKGSQVRLHHLEVTLLGFAPEKIFWVFPNAKELSIENTASPVWGLPGYFFAPEADLSFYEGLVTGALYVKNWIDDGVPGRNSGQVNGVFPPSNPLN